MSTMTHSDVQIKTMWNYTEIEHNIAFSFLYKNILASRKIGCSMVIYLMFYYAFSFEPHQLPQPIILLPLLMVSFLSQVFSLSAFTKCILPLASFVKHIQRKGRERGNRGIPEGMCKEKGSLEGMFIVHMNMSMLRTPMPQAHRNGRVFPMIHVQILTMCIENIIWSFLLEDVYILRLHSLQETTT